MTWLDFFGDGASVRYCLRWNKGGTFRKDFTSPPSLLSTAWAQLPHLELIKTSKSPRPLTLYEKKKKKTWSRWENMLFPQKLQPPATTSCFTVTSCRKNDSLEVSKMQPPHVDLCRIESVSLCLFHLDYYWKINQLFPSKTLVCFWDWYLFICES